MLSKILKFTSVVTIGILAASVPGAAARNVPRVSLKKAEKANVHVDEVAHLPLDGMHVDRMFVERLENNKVYLYLQRPAKEAFAVVDVTNPDKPVLLSGDALHEPTGSEVQPPAAGSVLAIAFIPEGSASLATEPLPTETVQFLDMSDPENVKSVRTIAGVTSVYADDARELVYLANGEGLWILSHSMPPAVHECGSGDALNPIPNCQ